MPVTTPHYFLEAFLDGDLYSAVADRRRFSTIDNQMYRVSELVGDGRIDGWEITPSTFPEVTINPGIGLINKYCVETFDTKTFTVAQNDVTYFFARRKNGIVGTIGPKSDIATVSYEDPFPPAPPANFIALLNPSDPYFSIDLSWSENTEIDFNLYVLDRGTDGVHYTNIATLNKGTTNYTDSVSENVTYYYRIQAVDLSGYGSTYSTQVIATLLSPVPPPDPLDVSMPPSERAINILWKRPAALSFDKIKQWELTYYKLLSNGDPDPHSTPITQIIDKELYQARIDDLNNGQLYNVTIKTVDRYDRVSNGISINVSPQPNPAPLDPTNINWLVTQGPNGIRVRFNWTSGANEYDPLEPYFYRIYVHVDGQPESAAITVPIGYTDDSIDLYALPSDPVNYYPLPENKFITFRLTSVSSNYSESSGNYVRLFIYAVTPARELINPEIDFNSETGKITVSWSNQPDTYNVHLNIVKDIPNDEYVYDIIFDGDIGNAESYVFDVVVGYRYTVRLTPYNANGVAGPTSILVEVILPENTPLPQPPSQVFAMGRDKEIKLVWEESSSEGVAHYRVYRHLGDLSVNYATWSLIDEVDKGTFSFVDYGLTNDSIYTYYVTSVDIYHQESLHLANGMINLNYAQAIPKSQGDLTAPFNFQVINIGTNIRLTWDALIEEFDAFIIYRSIDNLHSWELIASLPRESTEYLDSALPLIDKTEYHYIIGKVIDDAEIIAQDSSTTPQNSICIGKVTATDSSVTINDSCRRDIKNMEDPIQEYTSVYILAHKHRERDFFDPERINLTQNLIVTDWTTTDGKLFTTTVDISGGSDYILKVNNKFPSVFYSIQSDQGIITFSEPIVDIDPFTGLVVGDMPTVELIVMGVEEVQGILPSFRVDNFHARQVAFGRLNREQMPLISHEGRIREKMLPKRFALQKFSNYLYAVPEGDKDTSKTFGDGTAFFATFADAGLIDDLMDFDTYDDFSLVGFQRPSYSSDTVRNLKGTAFISGIESLNNANFYRFDSSSMFIQRESDNMLLAINRNSGNVDEIGNIPVKLTGLSFDKNNSILYGVSSRTGETHHYLYTVNVITGDELTTNEISGMSAGDFITDIAYNSNTDSLCAILEDISEVLWFCTIDYNTNSISKVKTIDKRCRGLAYNENNDTYYVTTIPDSGMIDPNYRFGYLSVSGPNYAVTTISITGYLIRSLTYNYFDSQFYGCGHLMPAGNEELIRLTIAGVLTVIADTFLSYSIEAPPSSYEFWLVDNVNLYVGSYPGLKADIYLKSYIDVPFYTTIANAQINFLATGSQGSETTLEVSALDPTGISDATDLELSAITVVPDLGTPVIEEITPWTDMNYEPVDITVPMSRFISNDLYFPGKPIFLRLKTSDFNQNFFHRNAGNYSTVNIESDNVEDSAGVNSDPGGLQSLKSYRFSFQFADSSPTRWVRLTTANTANKPNPIIDIHKRLRFKILLTKGSVYLTLGVRKLTITEATVGDDGGTIGPIEWVGIKSLATDENGSTAPIGKLIEASDSWQDVDIDIPHESVAPFLNGDGILTGDFGVLEHLAVTINPSDPNSTEKLNIYIDQLEQVTDILVAGTSQGVQYSRDFGGTWFVSRYSQTPVHKFYKGINNRFLWAISANQVFLTTDAAKWFATAGLTGVQYIRDITEDSEGNMYVSTDKGVYWFEVALVQSFPFWRQTSPIQAFTTECYAMHTVRISSGLDEIWVSTENGIFKTHDKGETWQDTLMRSEGLPVYKFIDINTGGGYENLVGITRKHVLRKLSTDSDFSTIANLEEQFGIFDLWTMEYFAGKIYLSAGKGVFENTNDVLFSSTPQNLLFKRVFTNLDINNNVCVAFGLNVIETENHEKLLFVGTENRLMSADTSNRLSIRTQYANKEIPSFYLNNEEVVIGYIYSSFNKALSFREPTLADDVVTAAYLPRKEFIPINGGWAQTNPETEVFIYVNYWPKWIDFALSSAAISATIDDTVSKMDSITLDDYNSLYPDSQNLLDDFKAGLASKKDSNGQYVINNDLITYFVYNYTSFVSMVTADVISTAGLDSSPVIALVGIPKENRRANSKAATLEQKDGFSADDSTGINVDAYSGKVSFLEVYNETTDPEKKANYEFSKYDHLNITLFNTQISGTGEFTHRELEDRMEDINTGLTSSLTKSAYTNLIKTGIFMESQHHHMFDLYKASRIQAKYYAAYTNEWYDMKNSTVDYETVIISPDGNAANYVKSTYFFDDEPYMANVVWAGTDNNIFEYLLNSDTGSVELIGTIAIDDKERIIWDIYALTDDEIYVVAEDKEFGHADIFVTTSFGGSWTKLDTIDLPDKVYQFRIINGNKVAATSEGPFYCDNQFGTWYKCIVTKSGKLDDDNAITAFSQKCFMLEMDRFIMTQINGWYYTSGNGIDWMALAGQMNNNDLRVINKLHRYKNLLWVGTDKGLYNDGNSILSDVVAFGFVTTIEDTAQKSVDVDITDITHDDTYLYCSGSNSKLYRYHRTNNEDEWDRYSVPEVTTIHKIQLMQDINAGKSYMAVFAQNRIKIIDVTPETGVFG